MKKERKLIEAIGMIDDKYIEEADMTKGNIKFRRIMVAAAAAAVLVCGSAVAGNIYIATREGGSSTIPVYTSVADRDKIYKDFGFYADLLESFSNGYTFEGGYKGSARDISDEGTVVNSFSVLTCEYSNGDDTIMLGMNAEGYDKYGEECEVIEYNGYKLYYSSRMYKAVPGDYVMTDQDKADEASGKYIFSYGTDEVEITEFKYLGWDQKGTSYSLSGHDTALTKDELVSMAEELIDIQK